MGGMETTIYPPLNISYYPYLSDHNLIPAITFANITVSDKKSKEGPCIGGFFIYDINEYLGIQPELLYTMKGIEWEGSESYTPYSTSIRTSKDAKYSYLEIPLLARLSYPMGKVRPKLIAGPAIGLKLSAKGKKHQLDMFRRPFVFEGDIEEAKNMEFGLVFGGGADFSVTDVVIITLDGRYNLGLTNAADGEWGGKHRVISILGGVGYAF